jgi:hypothetical protein
MSVQDEFFSGGGHDEASTPYQGVEGAAGDPQVIGGQHDSFAGRVQHAGSAAGSGWNIGGRGIPPCFQGHAPSHVSVDTHATIATSVVATSGYFGAICQSMAEINAGQVICIKNACGAHGSHYYSCHQKAATKALPHVFASASCQEFRGRCMPTSSPNMPGILLRSRSSSGIRTHHGMCQIPLSFLHSSTLMQSQ